MADEWVVDRPISDTKSPKVSDESQFHHPPHVPSWSAHQLPIHKATRFTKTACQVNDSEAGIVRDRAKGVCEDELHHMAAVVAKRKNTLK